MNVVLRSFFMFLMLITLVSCFTIETECNIAITQDNKLHCDLILTKPLFISKKGNISTIYKVEQNQLQYVMVFSIKDQIVHYLPYGFEGYFSHVTAVAITRTGLKEITRVDIGIFKDLIILNLSHNSIRKLEKNLFSINSYLRHLNLNDNQIQWIASDAFDGLKFINMVGLRENNCINEKAENKESFEGLKRKLNDFCDMENKPPITDKCLTKWSEDDCDEIMEEKLEEINKKSFLNTEEINRLNQSVKNLFADHLNYATSFDKLTQRVNDNNEILSDLNDKINSLNSSLSAMNETLNLLKPSESNEIVITLKMSNMTLIWCSVVIGIVVIFIFSFCVIKHLHKPKERKRKIAEELTQISFCEETMFKNVNERENFDVSNVEVGDDYEEIPGCKQTEVTYDNVWEGDDDAQYMEIQCNGEENKQENELPEYSVVDLTKKKQRE